MRIVLRQVSHHERGSLRHDNLATTGGRRNPGRPVHVQADVSILETLRFSRVEPHAHAQGDTPWPRMLLKPSLALECGGQNMMC